MGLGHSPSIIVDGLVFYIDPNNTNCYPGFGNTVYNLVNPSIGGTFVGYTSNPIDNTENRSLVYNGSTTYQEFYPIEPTRLTVSVWFKATGAPSLNDIYGGAILVSSPQYYISYGMLYRWTTNTVLFVQSQNGEIISANAPANKYVNAVYTYDGTNTKLYIDGVLASTVPYTTDPQYFGSGNRNLRLGVWGYPGYERYFNGIIGHVSIYNRALSATEILQNYNAAKKKYSPEENIVTNGLIFNIDPSKNTSYPGTGNTIYDLSGFGSTGTLTNGPTFSALNGGSIVFDGTNDYIDYPRSSLYDFGSSDFTIMYWINSTAKDRWNAVIDLNDAGGKMIIGINNNLSWMWFTSSYNIVGTINLCDGIWHQATISRIGSTLTHYVDGRVSVSTNVGATVVPSNNFLSIGRLVQTSSYGEIKLADVKIYKNRGLTQQEILQNYNATKNRFVNVLPPVRNGLVLELDAGQRSSYSGTGNTWYDLSGNSFNGTLTNGPTFSGIGATSTILTDGSNDYIISDVNKTVIGSSLTISFLLSMTSTSGGLLEISDSLGTGVPWIYLKRQSSSQIYWYLDGDYRFLVDLSTNEFAYITLTYTNNVWTSYKNGSAIGTASIGVGTYGGNNLRLGVGYHGYTTTKWNLFTIYNRALSAYEVKQNFDFYRTRYNI